MTSTINVSRSRDEIFAPYLRFDKFIYMCFFYKKRLYKDFEVENSRKIKIIQVIIEAQMK